VTALVVVLVVAVVMEPVTYAVHRWVMHGPGLGWHRSHHRSSGAGLDRSQARFERNDLYPVTFAGVTVLALAAGFNLPGAAGLVPVALGVTAYGLAYLAVHDLYIHRRLPGLRFRSARLDRLADAHALHHRFGGEPYGMLVPVVPRSVRARSTSEPLARPAPSAAPAGASGSTPSQVPAEW
jgi:beta-carotene 3-hydroxylase